MSDRLDLPIRAYPGAGEMIVKLSATATIAVESDAGNAILAITDGPLTVLLMPFSPSEGGPIHVCDVSLASELVIAASAYRDALAEAYAKQQEHSLPRRRAARSLVEHRELQESHAPAQVAS